MLGDNHTLIDHLDVLAGALRGIEDTGLSVRSRCDLSERRMYIKLVRPEIGLEAPRLLASFRSPSTTTRGTDDPLMLAGLVLSDSETDPSTFTLSPQLTNRVCGSSVTITKDTIHIPHFGTREPAAIAAWSAVSHRAVADAVAAHTRDAAWAFFDPGYLQATLQWLQAASVPVPHPERTIEHVCQALRFHGEQQAKILARFLAAEDLTSSGVLHAVASAAEDTADPDEAHAMERAAVRAMELAATHGHQRRPTGTA